MSLSCGDINPIRNSSVAGSTLQQLTNEVQHSNIISVTSHNTKESDIKQIAHFGMFSSSPTSSTSSSSTCESGVVLKSNSINSSLSGSPVSSKSSLSVITALSPTSSSVHNLIADLSNSRCHSGKKQTQDKSADMDICQTNETCNDMSSLVNLSSVSNMSINNAFGYANTDVKTRSNAQLLLNGLNAENNNQQLGVSNSLSDDSRTLQLALNLSMLGINESNVAFTNLPEQQVMLPQLQAQTTDKQTENATKMNLNTLNGLSMGISNTSNGQNYCNNIVQNSFSTKSNNTSALLLPPLEERSKKSQNMTECVPVPSSEHVAEIVGRQGCKIKALRAKTNTYIKTPVRGEEPVFVVTGRKEDVAKAKREILSAADHFSLIRATRKPSLEGSISSGGNDGNSNNGRTPPCPQSIPGQVTIQVRVPYRVVGLVVGPKGATIKHIQQETHTYIVTPSREKEPIFEVTGLPENVESARRQIEAHIAMRTGSLQNNYIANGISATDDAASSMHTMNTLSQILNEEINQDFLTTICKNGISSAFDFIESNNETANTSSSAVGFGSNADLAVGSFNLNNGSNCRGTSSHTTLLSSSSSINCSNFRMQTTFNNNQNSDYLKTLMCSVGGNGNGNDYECNIENNMPNFLHTNSISKFNEIGGNNNICVGNNNTNLIRTGVGGMMLNTNGMTRSCSSASSTTSSKSANKSGDSRNSASAKSNSSRPELVNIWQNLGDSCEVDEGIGDSPSIWTLPKSMVGLTGSHCSPTNSISPIDSLLGDVINSAAHYRRSEFNLMSTTNLKNAQQATELAAAMHNGENEQQQQQLLLMQQQMNGLRRDCLVCNDKEVTAALVPCGHNMFCMDCANRICTSLDASCPVCSVTVYHAMRILA